MSVFVSACEFVCVECRCTWKREGVGSPGAGVTGQGSGPPAGCWAAHRSSARALHTLDGWTTSPATRCRFSIKINHYCFEPQSSQPLTVCAFLCSVSDVACFMAGLCVRSALSSVSKIPALPDREGRYPCLSSAVAGHREHWAQPHPAALGFCSASPALPAPSLWLSLKGFKFDTINTA